jgi:hypothetical protein
MNALYVIEKINVMDIPSVKNSFILSDTIQLDDRKEREK